MKILGDDFMNKCPLCEIDYPHSHFSYDIAEYVDALQVKLHVAKSAINEALMELYYLQPRVDMYVIRSLDYTIEILNNKREQLEA